MTSPVNVTAPNSKVPVDEIVLVPVPLNKISAPAPDSVRPVVPERETFPETLVLSRIETSPDPESRTIFPVVLPPRVSVWLLVV